MIITSYKIQSSACKIKSVKSTLDGKPLTRHVRDIRGVSRGQILFRPELGFIPMVLWEPERWRGYWDLRERVWAEDHSKAGNTSPRWKGGEAPAVWWLWPPRTVCLPAPTAEGDARDRKAEPGSMDTWSSRLQGRSAVREAALWFFVP